MRKLSAIFQRRYVKRLSLISLAALLMVSTPLAYVEQARADQWDDQIAALQARADADQAQANAYRAKADTLQNKLDQINARIAALQSRIQANNLKRDKLTQEIADNQQKLTEAQDLLGNILANLYVDDNVTAIELLASSKNIGDYIDKQEYRSSVRDQLNGIISQVKELKAQLESEKKAVDKVLQQLNAQNNELSAQEATQQQLVNETRGQEAAYQDLVNQARDQMAAAAAQQRAYYASLLASGSGNSGVVGSFQYWGWSGNQGCSGGYAYCGGQDSYVDPWGLYNRECVSYVAWSLSARYHKYVGNFNGQGNAYQWPSSAPAFSGAVRVYSPQPGDAVILPATSGFAPLGHAMIVEQVSGANVLVSQFNFYGTGEYSTMYIKTTGVIFLRFPDA